MKIFLSAIICLCLMVVGFFCYLSYTNNVCRELVLALDEVLEAAEANDNEKVLQCVENFSDKWNDKRKILSIFSDSAVNDVITENIAALKYFAKLNEEGEVISRTGVLKEFIENIYRTEKPNFQNIL